MAKMSVRENREAHQLLTDAEKAAFRASRLTKQLLTFSKGGAPVKEAASIGSIVADAVGFCLSGSNVDYRLDLPQDLPPVEVDRGQIDQVMNNLVINADQAMPAGGMIEVRARQLAIGPREKVPLGEGRYVQIEVRDWGQGIPPEHRQRVFDPYFTTKQSGSGLGLTTAYSIVKKHGGHLTYVSKAGEGTTFQLYLPVSEKETQEETELGQAPVAAGGRVLLMDDDDTVRLVVRKLLADKGFEVEAVSNPSETVRIYKEAKNGDREFDAAVLDLTVPGGKGGKETAAELLSFDPGAKLIVASGYSNDPILANYREYGFAGMIAKPFDADQLVHTLSRVIQESD
jgi:CheY-like chemotaxis protein